MDEFHAEAANHDVIFTAASTGIIITKDDLAKMKPAGSCVAGSRRLVDIAVPRNVDGNCAEDENTICYNVDDLKELVELNKDKRLKVCTSSTLNLSSTYLFNPQPIIGVPAQSSTNHRLRSFKLFSTPLLFAPETNHPNLVPIRLRMRHATYSHMSKRRLKHGGTRWRQCRPLRNFVERPRRSAWRSWTRRRRSWGRE